MKKILITNDDGIEAEGILRLAKAAREFGQVWVAAPDGERSAASHSLTLRRPIKVSKRDFPAEGIQAYACDANPADCVRLGVLNIIPGGPDYVFSGINYGFNVASDIQYSATAGAAFEAAFLGIPAIAFSEAAAEEHEITDRYLKDIMEELMEKEPGKNRIWNVNFPGGRAGDCRGILRDRRVSGGMFFHDTYVEQKVDEKESIFTLQARRCYEAEEGTDLRAVLDQYISIGAVTNIF